MNSSIKDASQEGEIVPSISWKSSTDYEYVDAKFFYNTPTGLTCVEVTNEEDFTPGYQFSFYDDNICKNVVNPEEVEYESTGTDSNEYYIAPDGTIWETKNDYLAFTGSNNTSTTAEDKEVEHEESNDTYREDTSDYYVDEDGNYWASYEDYKLYKQYENEFTR